MMGFGLVFAYLDGCTIPNSDFSTKEKGQGHPTTKVQWLCDRMFTALMAIASSSSALRIQDELLR
jgi:hypothetical protein